jgi:hypothetical protein
MFAERSPRAGGSGFGNQERHAVHIIYCQEFSPCKH